MDRIIENFIASPFTNDDIMKLCEGKVSIFKYQDLAEFKPGPGAIDRLLGPHKAIIILYETAENYGHWVSFFALDDKKYEFFDSYGLPIDSELSFMDAYYRTESTKEVTGYRIPHLTYLIQSDHTIQNIVWNQTDLQSTKKDTNTCGRWASMRIQLRKVSLSTFQDAFLKNKTYSPDWWITACTFFIK